jgi:DnaJ family protein C protein 13
MRMFMIQKIALHLADFTPRLQSNTRAMYQYCPIPKIIFPRLENELFCSIYYLRNLCDETRFPDWPITDHIQLLKDVLDQWKIEVEKKPDTMSLDDAYETLGLDISEGEVPQSKIRKAYFKMSMKYVSTLPLLGSCRVCCLYLAPCAWPLCSSYFVDRGARI